METFTQDRTEDPFGFEYLPQSVAAAFRDTLGCFHHSLWVAFPAMCRLTAEAVFEDLGDKARLKLYDELEEIRELASLDDPMFHLVRGVLFDRDTAMPPTLDRIQATVLLETLKDLLYQAYVRGGKLRRALSMKRLFSATEAGSATSSG
ncbi:MAG: hypothetical protein JSV45_13860 [Chromatiales bacterium]|nr:MAG: hypothetical protein JSV45_13860 [Chromatiales bacterium]